ncbi:MAG TPA: ABC transporter substrate-binding protein [Candidatus Acidoferrales bacterium]|nr:ABC transporter substrate-binding protein [Candidatus Acidoferrales bacterium]
MSRRIVILNCLLIAVLLIAGLAEAQQPPKLRRIGLLSPTGAQIRAPFERRLQQLGYVEGQNVSIQHLYANGQLDRLPELAAELVRQQVELIVALSFPAALAAKRATTTIPVVVVDAGDPVATGLVASLARPGGNVTGVSAHETELSAKRLELLKEAFPKLNRVAVLWNSTDLGMTLRYRQVEGTAPALRVALQPLGIRASADFEEAFSAMRRHRPDALLVISDPLTSGNQTGLLAFAAETRLPAMYERPDFVDSGGLMFYGPNPAENLQRALHHVDRILKGAKPADLPVEQSMKFDFIINLKTANQIGVTIPPNVLARANKVIR